MKPRYTLSKFKFIMRVTFTWLTLTMSISTAQSGTLVYSLDNVFLDNNRTQQMTGSYEWNYQDGDLKMVPGYSLSYTSLGMAQILKH